VTKKDTGLIILLGALTAIGPFSIDMYLPAFPSIALDLSTDIEQVALSLTSFFIGISVGQLLYGPLIDRFGRKRPLVVGLLAYIVSAIVCSMSPAIEWLIGMRFLMALGGCVGMVASRAIVRDVFSPEETARVFSTLILVIGISPIVAPTIGGIVTASFGWRYLFYILAAFASGMTLIVFRYFPETKLPDQSISLLPGSVLKDFFNVLREPSFIVYSFAGALASAGMFAYISGSPFVYMKLFGLSEPQYGWAFGLNAMGLVAGSQLNRAWLYHHTSRQITLRAGAFQFLVGAALITGTWFGYLHTWGTMALVFGYLFWQGFIFPNATALALKPFTRFAGSASALIGSIQMGVGALASVLVSTLHNGTALPMAGVMAGCTMTSMALLLSSRKKMKKLTTAPAVLK
jgi:MFS transporter, DHA1 family, multidrug resistance protein